MVNDFEIVIAFQTKDIFNANYANETNYAKRLKNIREIRPIRAIRVKVFHFYPLPYFVGDAHERHSTK
jgi:hypothetical protein